MSQKPHVSYSQVNMYLRCGEQYRRRYVEGEIIPPGVAMVQGRAVHRAAQANFEQKRDTHRDLPIREVVEIAAAAFEQDVQAGVWLSPEEESVGKEKVLGQAKDATVRLAEAHAQHQAPDYQPQAVEQFFRLELPAPRDVVGVVDLTDQEGRVVDLKTTTRRIPQERADKSLQLTLYAAAYHQQTGRFPQEVRLDVLVDGRRETSRQVLASHRDRSDVEVAARRLATVIESIEKGVFVPAPEDAWCCSPRWCGYFHSCPFAIRRNGNGQAK